MSTHEERCPYCESSRITTHFALNAIKQTCDRCGKEWGDVMGHHKASIQLADERRDREARQPSAFRGEGPPIVLFGVSSWWFQ
jgi:hypothetical protein